jgi:hypothetical protein
MNSAEFQRYRTPMFKSMKVRIWLLEKGGIEPTTSSMPLKRSGNISDGW